MKPHRSVKPRLDREEEVRRARVKKALLSAWMWVGLIVGLLLLAANIVATRTAASARDGEAIAISMVRTLALVAFVLVQIARIRRASK